MKREYRELSAEEANVSLSDFHVVDVRTREEWDGPLGRVVGSELAPLDELDAHFGRLAEAGPLLLVCRSGRRSAAACEQLIASGITDVANLAGGMLEWNEQGYPVEGGSAGEGA